MRCGDFLRCGAGERGAKLVSEGDDICVPGMGLLSGCERQADDEGENAKGHRFHEFRVAAGLGFLVLGLRVESVTAC